MTLRCTEIALAAGLEPAKQSGDEIFHRCPNHDDKNPSLQINAKKNCFLCGPCGKSGGAWKLAAFLAKRDPADKQGIVRWLNEKGFHNSRLGSRADSSTDSQSWKSLWKHSIPIDDKRASIVCSYLRNRGLNTAILPSCIRCHADLPYWEKDQNGKPYKKEQYPALIALATDESGKPTGILRIYLTVEGFKAPESEPKKALGIVKGAAIHLDEPKAVLHVTEGLETGMSVFQSIQEPTWPALSASGIRALCLPKEIKVLHIWADDDRNQAGQNAAFELARKAILLGIIVFIHIPAEPIPADKKKLDWLDVLNTKGSNALVAELREAEPCKIADMPDADNVSADDWDPPVPFRQFNLPPFPTHVFPGWLRNFVEAEAIATQTPMDLSGMLSFSVLATTCQKKFVVQVKSGWIEPTNIYTGTALPPGNRKSADFADMVEPLEEYEEAEAARMAPEIAAAQTRFKILESRLHDKQTAASKAKTMEEQVQFEQEAIQMAKELAQMSVPVAPRLLADDATPERLTTLIRDQGGRMAVMSPEGDVFELMAGRYSKNGAPNFAVYLKGHSGDTLRVDRTGRPSEYVKRPTLTVGFAIQPDVIRGLSQKEGFRGRGLLARFLFSLPESLLGHRDPNAPEVPNGIRAIYRRNVLALLGLPFAKDEQGNPSAHYLKLDPSARAALLQFAADLEPKIAPLGELGSIADWAGKLVGAVARISGLLHVALHISDYEPWAIPIELTTIEKAILVGHYLIPHARAAFSEMGADPAVEEARHILSWIKKKHQSTIKKRDIFEGTKGRFKRAEDLDKPLDVLLEHEYLRQMAGPERRGPGKPPSPVFEVNPFIWGDSANIANIEDDPLKSHLKDSLSAREKDSDPSPAQPSHLDPVSSSQYSHNSQNPEGNEKGQDITDSPESEEIFL
jgi:replicative DNA helicase